MKNIFFIFILFLSFHYVSAQQSFCIGAIKNYSVDLADGATGTPGSTYVWSVDEAGFLGLISGNPSLTGNAISINWGSTPAGSYTLRVIETNSDGCVGDPVTLDIIIHDLPTITGDDEACVGETIQLTGTATANATNPWTSSNTSVATISSTGLVTAISEGSTTITYVNSNGCSIIKEIIINALPTITGNDAVCVGGTIQLTGSATANTTTPWISSDIDVATISSTGLVTAIAAGTTTITYTNSNGCMITKTITVNALPTITGNNSACVGGTIQLTGSATANASNPWVSSNTSVATISSSGLVTAVASGTTVITYTNSNGCSITQSITINALPTITGADEACVGQTIQLTGSATANATNPWISSNTLVATISSTGLITAVSGGTTTITYTNSNGCIITKVITINALPTTSPINFD